MKLHHNFVELKIEKADNKTKNGILLAEKSKSYPPIGTVTEVGPDVEKVKKGDRVIFLRYAAIDSLEDDRRICKEQHIIGTL